MPTRKLEVQILGDSSSLERAFGRSARAGQGFAGGIGGASRRIARNIAALGAAAGALGVVTGKSFSSFEQSMDRVVGLAGGAREQVAKFSKEILKIAPTVGKGPQELGEALYFTASAGIAVSKQMSVVVAAAKASAAGLGETKTVADAVTSAMNAYGPAVVNAAKATDVLVATVREGKGEAAAFAPVIGTVAAIASQLGVAFNEVGAALASQTRLGVSAETAAIQLQAVFSSLLKGDSVPKAAKALKTVGLNFADLRDQLKQKGLLSVLDTLKGAFGENAAAMAQAFPNIRALRGLLNLVGKNAEQVRGVFDRMRESTGALDIAFGAVNKGEAFKFKQTMASLAVVGIRLGAIFAPVAKLIADGATKALGVVSDFLEKLGEAKTIRAKLDVIWEGVQDAAAGATSALERAVRAIDFDAVWAQARGVADGLQKRLEEVDFGVIGKRIGDGIADAVKVAIPATRDLAERISNAVSAIDFEELGKKMGPGLAAAVVTAFVTLLDPAFWVRNWDLALAIAATVFRARIATFAVKLLAPLGRIGGSIVLGIVAGIERFAPRLASTLLTALMALPKLVLRALSPLRAVVSRVFDQLGRVSQFLVRVLGIQAVINAVVGLGRKVGNVFKNLGNTISSALDRAFNFLKRKAIEAALAIIEPFTHLPGFLGGGAFQDLKTRWQDTLSVMDANAKSSTDVIQRSIDGLQGKIVTVTVNTVSKGGLGDERGFRKGTARATSGAANAVSRAAATGAKKVAADAVAVASQITTAEKKAAEAIKTARVAAAAVSKKAAAAAAKALKKSQEAFAVLMDSLSLNLERAQATAGFGDDLLALKKIENAIKARIKVEGSTTELARELFQNRQQQIQVTRGVFDEIIDGLNLNLERAQVTRGMKDDLKALRQIEAAIRKRIQVEGRTTELARQLFQNRQQQAATIAQQRNAKQFKALGLTATGDKRTPGPVALLKRAGTLKNLVKGTFLDTPKTRSQFANIGKALAAGVGKVGKEVRDAVLQMLNDISGALDGKTGGKLTAHRITDPNKILEGLGLTPEQQRQMRARLISQSSGGGFRTTPGQGAFGFSKFGPGDPASASAGFGGGLAGAMIFNGPITVVSNDVDAMGRQLGKKARRAVKSRGGRFAGNRGL